MSNRNFESLFASPSMEMNPSRPQQQGRLLLLPTEILLQITGEPGRGEGTIPYKDLKRLALSCSRFFYLIRPMYYVADNYAVFHSAVAHRDLEVIQRCIQFRAAPRTVTQLPHGCTCPSELPHESHSLLDSLLECFVFGSFPIDKSLEALKWLLDGDLEGSNPTDQPWHKDHCLDDYHHIPELLITFLGQNTDRARTTEIIEMIEALRSYGFSLPYHGLAYTPFDVALRPHCPSNFLGIVLEEYKRRGLSIKAACSTQPYQVGSWGGYSWPRLDGWWRLRTNIGSVAWGLFLGITDASMVWKESYLGEVTHGFQEKIQLLVDYEAVDSDELLALQCILQALEGITSDAQRLGGFDEERDGKACWLRLCEANPRFRADMSFSWMREDGWDLKQNEKGLWYDRMWDHFQNPERCLLILPKWQPVNFEDLTRQYKSPAIPISALFLSSFYNKPQHTPYTVSRTITHFHTKSHKANMPDHHIEDLPLSSSSKQMTSSRPQHQENSAQQEGRLALLPVEVLLNITGEPGKGEPGKGEPGKDEQTLSHQDFKSLALSSGVFFRELRQAYYCADNFAVFHSALRCADVEAMERCYNLAKPPIDLTWEVSCQCPSDKAHNHHRPIDVVLECLAIDSVPIDRCIEAIRWLLSKGYEANEQRDQAWYRNDQHCYHMPELVIDLLGKTSDKARVEGICEIITMLHNHGYSLPYRMNLHQFFRRSYDQKVKPGLIRKPMDIALRSHCPISFLELILQEYQRRGVNALAVHDGCPPEMTTWVGIWPFYYWELPFWRQSTNFGNVLWGLFLDIADPSTSWKESYQGEAADILEKKIQLLIEYQFVQLQETKVLRRLVTALRENPLDFKFINKDNDRKVYWETLCAYLGPLMEDEGLVKDDRLIGYETVQIAVGRLHRFVIEASWNPWTVWQDYKMQDPKHRANFSHPWTGHERWGRVQKRHGIWFDPEWRGLAEYEDVADAEIGRKRDKDSLPNWNTVNYDGFVAAVERLWEQENAKLQARTLMMRQQRG
ncbi:hypothetical protein FNAPI_6197 [Fusarium napiforme]|uniref:F-box domain-containing protein n=1 Tax=Fusarium napiforme TaxID=42672 RepID=A0A8H5JIG4_9HYPO|nr:hypothetical protein FNAPI_6197 [Fusarium napiforme]